jgi:DNA invertase Pin-like site-specific DNA recombinase
MTTNAIPAVDKTQISRAASVLRVSSAGQSGEEKDSVPGQRRFADAMAAAKGWTLVAEFDENADTGFQSGRDRLEDRPSVQSMLAAAERGEFDVVIFKNPSRGSREVVELQTLARELRELGVLLAYSETQHILDWTDSMDQIVIMLGGWMAEADWSQIRKNLAGGRHGAAAKGGWITGAPPTGYRTASAKDKRLVIDEDEAEIIRYAFECILAGDTITEATARLNARWPSYQGKRSGKRSATGFAASTVGGWLRKPAYAGRGIERKVAPAPGAPHEVLIAPTPAIVSEETFDKVQMLIAGRVAQWREERNIGPDHGRKKYVYALAGGALVHLHPSGLEVPLSGSPRNGRRLMRCSHSTTKYKERWQDRPEYDPCAGWGANRQNGVALVSTPAALIEAKTILRLAEAFESEKAMAALQQKADRQVLAIEETKDVLSAAIEEKAVLKKERETIIKQEQRGRITEDEAEEAFENLAGRLLENEERIARAERNADTLDGYSYTMEDLLAVTVGYLDITPDHDAEWPEVIRLLRGDAEQVLDGGRADLDSHSIDWLAAMVRRFDVRVYIQDGNDEEDRGLWWVWADADEALILSPTKTAEGRRGTPSGAVK